MQSLKVVLNIHLKVHKKNLSCLRRLLNNNSFENIKCGHNPVQYKCIPSAIMGIDILCQAKSGMGKTAVFVLSVLQQLMITPNTVSCLVLCHTRELAFQISQEFCRFSKHIQGIEVAAFYGGIPEEKNQEHIKNHSPNIVVGTPGRIKSLSESKHLDLSKIRFFILDECDKLLDGLCLYLTLFFFILKKKNSVSEKIFIKIQKQ